ncbi:hypothetical protein H0H81_000842 [Sphagnurus paluster]|uniref:lytic cellulose monooxygenase (C4-dehydrogenating) n=1 Tax=Sphagnurus paluster TaxID=117069 RepID=A0A9P7KFA9_9AGAR|nr:hypothetical protein H0H81_000842 [Sphagnurus paluster]
MLMYSLSLLLTTSALLGQVAAHGYVPFIKINGQTIAGWDITKGKAPYKFKIISETNKHALSDPYTNPQPLRVVRGTKLDSGFIDNPASADITCSIGNQKLPPGPITATVAAGGTVEVLWNTWPIGHYGPVINYMAKCPSSGCSSWKADSGSPWFKIQQDSYKNGEWASDTLAKNGFKYTVKIPSKIAAGDYLLRHENLALHGASSLGGAQFYPVTGGGNLNPSGLSFPGAYKATDPGILFNPYQGDAANKAYVPPGGSVYPGLN